MLLLYQGEMIGSRPGIGKDAAEAGVEEEKLKPARMTCKLALVTLLALSAIPLFTTAAQNPAGSAKSFDSNGNPVLSKLPKIWHSEATKHDFRVEVTNDLFRAEWVDMPPAAAKQGAYIRTECRRAGTKWVGSSRVNMLFAIPGAPSGKDTKVCALTVRFEVDSVSPEKITGHSEAIHAFDVNACRVEETKWGSFTWVPKK